MRILKNIKEFKWSYIIIEMFIITLGILVALQIDKWKESVDKTEREIKILKELKSSLSDDLKFLKMMRIRYNDVIESASKLQRHLFLKREYNDSIQHFVEKTAYGFTFKYRNGVYENLKSQGIDIISNDSIKHKVLTLYDFEYPRQTEIITRTSNERLTPYIRDKYINELTINDKGEIQSRLIINKETIKEEEFLNFVTDRLEEAKGIKRRFELLINFVEDLTKDIDKEINERR